VHGVHVQVAGLEYRVNAWDKAVVAQGWAVAENHVAGQHVKVRVGSEESPGTGIEMPGAEVVRLGMAVPVLASEAEGVGGAGISTLRTA